MIKEVLKMRILKFIIDGQTIRKDPSCDYEHIVSGTKGYLCASFSFSADWDGCRKAAIFSCLGRDHPVPIINNKCQIQEEALLYKYFRVKVVGEKDGYRITTNSEEVKQDA